LKVQVPQADLWQEFFIMLKRKLLKQTRIIQSLCLLLFPLPLFASFIESTIGAAVVNDATATYYNPAALTLLKNSQLIPIGTLANLHTHFRGESTQANTGFTQSGSSNLDTRYVLPSFYAAIPATKKVTIGFAAISDNFNSNVEDNSILRYAQSSKDIRGIDLVPAIGIKLNEFFSFGAGINFSYSKFNLQPISGFPTLNIPDSESKNETNGSGIGGDVGVLVKPGRATLIGLNYHTAITYRQKGTSVLEGFPEIVSDNYHFDFWTPASTVLSINHFVTPNLGFLGTIRHIQWNIFDEINLHGIATRIGAHPAIVNANVPFHFQNTWLLTLGSNYRITPKWVVRLAGSYSQSPANSNYQISNGDSIILAASTGYEISKNITIDAGYAYSFMRNEDIDIIVGRNFTNGVNEGFRNAFSLKLTFNMV
jgi:long-subunit fatty acid transport protein